MGLFSTKMKAPKRDLTGEINQTFAAQSELAPKMFQKGLEYVPQFTAAQGAAMGGISSMMREQAPQYYQLQDQLAGQAVDELGRGGYLGADEQRMIEQDSRAAWNDRGLGRSNPAMMTEALNLYGARRNRLNEARNFATGVSGILAQDRDQAYGIARQNVGQAMSMFDPFGNQYAQDLYNTNFNAKAATNMAKANNSMALIGGAMGMGGQLGGAGITALALCWVAREVYGLHDRRWRVFRSWLLSEAPRWFRGLYIAFGPEFAVWIRNKPLMKRLVKRWMDKVVNKHDSSDVPGAYRDVVGEV